MGDYVVVGDLGTIARDAAGRGAKVLTKARVTAIAQEGAGWRVDARGAGSAGSGGTIFFTPGGG